MKKIIAVSIMIVLLCTGCSSNISVTKEQNDLMAEYVAGVLLKYSYENEWNYTKVRKAKSGISGSVSASKSSSGGNSSASVSSGNGNSSTSVSSTNSVNQTAAEGESTSNADALDMMVQGLNLGGAKIKFSKYVVASNYPEENLVLSVPAGAGNKVVVLEFEISNPTSSSITCNTVSNNTSIKLLINNETGVSESVTMLKNDLLNLNNISISPGDSYTAAAIFIVPESKASGVSNLTISVALNGGSAVSKKLL